MAVAAAVGLFALAPPALTAKDGDEPADPRLPASWAGLWEITVTYRDAATHNVRAVDDITEVICRHEPVGLAAFEDQADCAGKVSGHHLTVRCTSQFHEGACSIKGALHVSSERTGDTLLGSGQWSAMVTGMCGPLVSGGELIEVSGVRLKKDQAACPQSRSSLIKKFATHPLVLLMAGRGR